MAFVLGILARTPCWELITEDLVQVLDVDEVLDVVKEVRSQPLPNQAKALVPPQGPSTFEESGSAG